jgi:glycosyltransferase involved in cell wall biosynthesis
MSDRLRVLLLNERCTSNPLAGGAEVHLAQIFSRLTNELEIEWLCCGYDRCAPTGSARGIPITRLGNRFSYYAFLPAEVRRRVATGHLDLIIEAFNKLPFLTPLYAPGVPKLVIHHHLHGWTAFRQVPAPIALASVLLESSIPFVYRGVPVLAISDSSRTDLVRRGLAENDIDIVPCGVDHELHTPARIGGRRPILISVGRLEPYKRLDLLIHAMPKVVAAVADVHLIIVGSGQKRPALEALTERLRMSYWVSFMGVVPDAIKVSLLQQAALAVQCSCKEGWGLTVFEAYSCGTPVVASHVPGLSDSVQDGITGRLVHKPDPKTLAGAITRLLLDEEQRAEMGRRALAWSQSFTWERSAQSVLRAIQHAAHARRPTFSSHSPSPAPVARTAEVGVSP